MRTVYPPSLLAMFMDLPIYFLFPLVQFTEFGEKSRRSMGRLVAAFAACTRVPAAPIAGAPGCACFGMIDCGSAIVSGRWPCACSAERDHLREGACVRRCRREGGRCEKTEAAIKEPIAAPAWQHYGTRPPLRHLCVLLAVRAAGVGFVWCVCVCGRASTCSWRGINRGLAARCAACPSSRRPSGTVR